MIILDSNLEYVILKQGGVLNDAPKSLGRVPNFKLAVTIVVS